MANVINLSHQYLLTDGELNIHTPFVSDFDAEVTNVLIEQSSNLMKRLSFYPRGFVIYFEQSAKGVLFKTNYPLNRNADGSYDVIF